MSLDRGDHVFLIVTADDFGMTSERDKGIIEAKKNGIVTNTSVLVNGSTAVEAVQDAKRCGLSLGLHLNLTEGQPLAGVAKVPSLLANGPKWWPKRKESVESVDGEEIQFRGKDGIRQALKDGNISMVEVELEVRAQLEAFRDMAGSYPTYLDGHQHIHVLPGLVGVIAKVAADVGVRCVRIPHEEATCFAHVEPAKRRQFYEQICCQSSAARAAYAEAGIWFPSDFVGYGLMGDDISPDRLRERLQKLASSGPAMELKGEPATRMVVGEYMNHVGYASAAGDDFAKSAAREKELGVLTDPALPKLLEALGIRAIDYEEMVRLLEARGHKAPLATMEVERRRGSNQRKSSSEGGGGANHSEGGGAHEAADDRGQQPSLPAGGVEDRSRSGEAAEEGKQGGGKGKVVVVASMTKATGNAMTALRMQRIAEAAGWETTARDVGDIADAAAMQRAVEEEGATAVFGVHLHRAGRLFIGLPVPYCLVLGGTDVNVFTEKEDKRLVMQQALDGCRCVISFNEGMLNRMRQSLAFSGPVFIIPQTAPLQAPSAASVAAVQGRLQLLGIPPDAHLFLLPCGIRPVKDPCFLVEAWKQQRKTEEGKGMWLLIVGPVLDKDCMLGLEHTMFNASNGGCAKLPRQDSATWQDGPDAPLVADGVAYLPPVEHEELLSLMSLCKAVVNSSVAEGMCGSLLEAMALGVPVLARAVPGNLELVRHGTTGLLFATQAEALQQAQDLVQRHELSKALSDSASIYLDMHHSVERERSVLVEAFNRLC